MTRWARIGALAAFIAIVGVPLPAMVIPGVMAAVAIGLVLFLIWEVLAAAEEDAFMAGAGPWVAEATNVTEGGAVLQSLDGSSVSACGEILTGGALTEAHLLVELGEWSDPGALAAALNAEATPDGWQGGYFASGDDALAVAEQGELAATLQGPGLPAHMVVIAPGPDPGTFTVSDPGIGGRYEVTAAWIEKYVSGGVWR